MVLLKRKENSIHCRVLRSEEDEEKKKRVRKKELPQKLRTKQRTT